MVHHARKGHVFSNVLSSQMSGKGKLGNRYVLGNRLDRLGFTLGCWL